MGTVTTMFRGNFLWYRPVHELLWQKVNPLHQKRKEVPFGDMVQEALVYVKKQEVKTRTFYLVRGYKEDSIHVVCVYNIGGFADMLHFFSQEAVNHVNSSKDKDAYLACYEVNPGTGDEEDTVTLYTYSALGKLVSETVYQALDGTPPPHNQSALIKRKIDVEVMALLICRNGLSEELFLMIHNYVKTIPTQSHNG